jgi:hypothetical protein
MHEHYDKQNKRCVQQYYHTPSLLLVAVMVQSPIDVKMKYVCTACMLYNV